MLTNDLQNAAELFTVSLTSSPEMEAFVRAKVAFRNDPELREMRKRLADRNNELRAKQPTTPLTQEEIDEVRLLQHTLNAHPVTTQFVQARQALILRLSECNDAISKEIGFDFAGAAASPSCCG